MYSLYPYDQSELISAMQAAYEDIINFVATPVFQAVIADLNKLDSTKRPEFVLSVLLNPNELERRGVTVPEGLLIQRSAFGDRRPTLFCVKKFLPEKYHSAWENVNLTFDEFFPEESVSRAPEITWRKPLPIDLQAKAMAEGVNLEAVSVT